MTKHAHLCVTVCINDGASFSSASAVAVKEILKLSMCVCACLCGSTPFKRTLLPKTLQLP